MTTAVDKEEARKRLTPLQWHVTQEKGTERPFTGCYNKFYEKGTYTCIVCDQELFSSETKYDSGCGWPAFNEVLDQGRVKLTKDVSHVGGNLLLLIANPDMVRTEVTCSKCNAHLGHVFNDGPKPTRKRFCINSASISFHAAGEEKKSTFCESLPSILFTCRDKSFPTDFSHATRSYFYVISSAISALCYCLFPRYYKYVYTYPY